MAKENGSNSLRTNTQYFHKAAFGEKQELVRLAVRQWKKDKVVLLAIGRGDKQKNEPAFQRSVKCGPVFCSLALLLKAYLLLSKVA